MLNSLLSFLWILGKYNRVCLHLQKEHPKFNLSFFFFLLPTSSSFFFFPLVLLLYCFVLFSRYNMCHSQNQKWLNSGCPYLSIWDFFWFNLCCIERTVQGILWISYVMWLGNYEEHITSWTHGSHAWSQEAEAGGLLLSYIVISWRGGG